MKIFIASDHAGYELKSSLVNHYKNKYDIEDLGPLKYDANDDYPDFAYLLGKSVVKEPGSRGILICKNGVGVSIMANRIRGIRAVVTVYEDILTSSRNDDDSNVLCLASSIFDENKAIEFIEQWINTPFSNEERHIRRINKLDSY